MPEAKPATGETRQQAQELYCPRCGLRLALVSRGKGPCSVTYSVANWAKRCAQLELDSPLACLMSARRDRDLY